MREIVHDVKNLITDLVDDYRRDKMEFLGNVLGALTIVVFVYALLILGSVTK
ncbi:hypothetical protein UFOVP1336_17 [uncultured Caudovirales phage]|uniref:Uncharacterized protein n=1 Tax=uncultured Caudovirales phage TaxID=2100421 RepID=A0A6J5RPY4_9CAUD|nr:hypothetical protein UFOVP1336_17 [uncultured Caudovirales phage]